MTPEELTAARASIEKMLDAMSPDDRYSLAVLMMFSGAREIPPEHIPDMPLNLSGDAAKHAAEVMDSFARKLKRKSGQ